jgi:transcriptional regulatory protein LevR
MDQQIQERLQIYEREGLASPAIVKCVHGVLQWLEQTSQHDCTEEFAGTFASHLLLALMRVSQGEQLGEAWNQDVHDEAITLYTLLPWVQHIQKHISDELSLTLPPEETDFLLLHLGTFLLNYNDPLVMRTDN